MKKLSALALLGVAMMAASCEATAPATQDEPVPLKADPTVEKLSKLPRLKHAALIILSTYALRDKEFPLGYPHYRDDLSFFTAFFTDEGTPASLVGDLVDFKKQFEARGLADEDRERFLADVWVQLRLGKIVSPRDPISQKEALFAVGRMVQLTVVSDPERASVFCWSGLDPVGQTKVKIWVPPGTVQIKVMLDGYKAHVEDIEVKGDRDYKVTLEKLDGK